MHTYTAEDCEQTGYGFALNNKAVVVQKDVLLELDSGQLFFCAGGNEAATNQMGRAVFLISLANGEQYRFSCNDVIGTLKPELLRDFGPPDPANYQQVFDGAVDTNDLEALYFKFNIDHPSTYTGYSLSMSDVVELYDDLASTFHYVDRFGFKQVDFEPPAPAIQQSMQF